MKLSRLAGTIFLILSTTAQAQQVRIVDYSTLPACASQCTLLKSAESGCVPPAAPVDTTNTYTNCFCESALIKSMWSTSQGFCDGICGASDLSTIRKWFLTFCQGRQLPGVVPVPETGSGSSPTTKGGSKATNSAGAKAGGSGSSGASSGSSGSGGGLTWHSAGVPLLITVLLLLFLVILPAGIYLCIRKRRRAAAEAQQMARQSGVNTPVAWGPHQNMAWTEGYRYDIPGVIRKPGEKNGMEVQEAEVGSQASRTVASGTSDEISVKNDTGVKKGIRPRHDGMF